MEDKKILEELKQQTEKKIEEVMQQGIQQNNIDMIYTLMDIHKDIENEEYWKEKVEGMRYSRSGYGDHREMEHDMYGRRRRDSRGRYMDGGMSDRRYRGHDMIDEMYHGYTEYHEGKNRYGAGPETMEPLEAMLESVVDFVEMLKRDAGSQQEMDLIRHYTKKISEM